MIGIVIITHGDLAREFRLALEHVVGPQERLETLSIGPEDDMETRRGELIAAVNRCKGDSGVIILTDMFGGTPSNLAMTFLGQQDVEVVTGVNLPMLISLAGARASVDLRTGARDAREHGRNAIWVTSELLRGDHERS